ncbi:hypothetical protein P8452_73406 [Trifolium repens]|nr:hypothetical protein P8452_73406 [Trifolium repens]
MFQLIEGFVVPEKLDTLRVQPQGNFQYEVGVPMMCVQTTHGVEVEFRNDKMKVVDEKLKMIERMCNLKAYGDPNDAKSNVLLGW